MFQTPAALPSHQVVSVATTDDCIFAAPFGSPVKDRVMHQLGTHCEHTAKDPLVNISGCTVHRDRASRRTGTTQPLHLDSLAFKYPLAPGEECPSAPFPYSDCTSSRDRAAVLTLLPSKGTRHFQSTLGDTLWLQRLPKPELVLAHQHLCRTTRPTLLDYSLAARAAHYCTGKKDGTRWTGGAHGPTITPSADSSFASHPDLKSQSCWTVHAGGGGATTCESKKQATTADSSTTAENTFEELGLPQPTALGTGSDSQSAMKLLQSPASKGKARHLDLRYSTLREKTESGTTRLFYTPTDHMTADTGTKALVVLVSKLSALPASRHTISLAR